MRKYITYTLIVVAALALALVLVGPATGNNTTGTTTTATTHHSKNLYHPHHCATRPSPESTITCAKRELRHDTSAARWTKNHQDTARSAGLHSVAYFLWRIRIDRSWIQHATYRILSRGGTPMRAYALRTDSCLAQITDNYENGSWDPTVNYGGGHGDTSLAYGIPQAYPGTKLAYWAYTIPSRHEFAGKSIGKNWATDAMLQWEWMKNYATGRYGGSCEALNYRITYNTY